MSCAHGHVPGCLQCKARRSHRRTLSNLETIVGFATLVRSRTNANVTQSIGLAATAFALENAGGAPRGGLGAIVAAAHERARRGVR